MHTGRRQSFQAPKWPPDERGEYGHAQGDYRHEYEGQSSRQTSGRYDGQYERDDGYNDGYGRSGQDSGYDDRYGRSGQNDSYERRYDRSGQSDSYERRYDRSGQSDSYERRYDRSGQSDSYERRYDRSGQSDSYERRYDRLGQNDSYERRYDRSGQSDIYERRYGEYGGTRREPDSLDKLTAAVRGALGRLCAHREQRRHDRYEGSARREPRAGDQPAVFGGREHDNIHAADARPGVGMWPIVGMVAVLVLLVAIVPLIVSAWNRRASVGEGVNAGGVQSVRITAQPGTVVPTPTPEPTPQATEQATSEAISQNLMVSTYTGRTLSRDLPAVALTFDDGPSDQTLRILEALRQNDALGSFFLIGERVASGQYPDVARALEEAGCLVGTHLYSHTRLDELSTEALAQELDMCINAHLAAGASAPAMARAPYGQAGTAALSALDMPVVSWSLNSDDWQLKDAQAIYEQVMAQVQDGDIVLFHDLKEFTSQAIELIAPGLRAQGYQLVTVQELFELKGRALEPGVLYSQRVVLEGT